MHDHNENKGGAGMLWAMVLCCTLPLLLVFIFGATAGRGSGGSIGTILGVVVVMGLVHFFIMRKMHKRHNDQQHESTNDKDTHSRHNCCR